MALLAALACVPGAHATPTGPLFHDQPPPGFRLSADQVLKTAGHLPEVRRLQDRERVRAAASYEPNGRQWQVDYLAGDEGRLQVVIDDGSGRVVRVWRGTQARWAITRPQEGKFGRKLNALPVWLLLCALFVLPFVDPRRPFRLLHLDLLVLLAFGVSQIYFNKGDLQTAMPLAYPVLAYLLVRMLVAGLRPRAGPGRLVPVVPMVALVVGLAFLVGFRVVMNVTDSGVTDVGYAGVIGADRIVRGDALYTGHFPESNPSGDTYGPVNYLSYIPFTAAFGWSGEWDDLPAAHAASIFFDLLALAGLFLLGRSIRAGPEGTRLGIALAYALGGFPYTAYALQANTNDALLAALLCFALVALASPPGRGALLALAGAAKLVPFVLTPLFLTGTGERSPRRLLAFAAAFSAVLLFLVVPFLFEVGPAQVYERTFAAQFERKSPFSLWSSVPSLEWAQTVVQIGTVVLAFVVAFVPARRDVLGVAALGAAVLIAFELSLSHWFYLYIVWFLPFVLVALFGAHREPRQTVNP